jgi:8-oxo-dGTP pyrophosphatase MutT (NUDIX family)
VTPPAYSDIRSRLALRSPVKVETPGLLETAVAMILAPGPDGPEALFIRRAQRDGDPWSGHIGLPGGRREPSDRDRLHTAVRETAEEVLVELLEAALLGALDDLSATSPTLTSLVIRPFVFGFETRPQASLSPEVAAVHWIGLGRLRGCSGETELSIGGRTTAVPCFKPDGIVIWGLTYRIVSAFLPFLD